ncbi:hypothetical protein [Companilactobacillus ginsenosidimutans]|uniref:Uncharacterized protein n=1 Tax=Companilactobacillus ginsenosidimutans TaxID=1007676 RepID=A0A0H4QIG6_9LACO|nr:hypothetical protein [Companilactobacillus ginsenosidimutans]AKP67737.1 hypothetical protein ABM34_09495 [Companilactobacillus ginsenosidimutans]
MHQAKKSKKKPVLFTILGIVLILVLGVVFFVPLNNATRSATGSDTPTDRLIKHELVKKVKSNKTGDPDQDAKVDKYADKLQETKMSEIMAAANNQAKAAKLIQSTSNLSKPAADKAAQEIFTNNKFNSIRSSMSQGDWVQTYLQYRTLSKDGTLSALKQNVNQ